MLKKKWLEQTAAVVFQLKQPFHHDFINQMLDRSSCSGEKLSLLCTLVANTQLSLAMTPARHQNYGRLLRSSACLKRPSPDANAITGPSQKCEANKFFVTRT